MVLVPGEGPAAPRMPTKTSSRERATSLEHHRDAVPRWVLVSLATSLVVSALPSSLNRRRDVLQ